MKRVSPGLTAGGGLKRPSWCSDTTARCVSPGLTAGGGLKQVSIRAGDDPAGFPRPHRRGRIETGKRTTGEQQQGVSPGLTAGGGLKRETDPPCPGRLVVSPGLTAGGGLKLGCCLGR